MKINFAQTIGILANIGVIVGIAFLALQIRQSNVQVGVATLLEDGAGWSEWLYELGSDAEAANIYYQGLRDFGQLTPVDQLRFDLLIRSYLYRLEVNFEASGNLGFNIGAARRKKTVEALFAQDGFREWWTYTDRDTLPRPLREYLEEIDPETK
jgi:hypothetical protein